MATKRNRPKAKGGKRSDSPADRLQRALAAYIKARGGSALVVGPIAIQQWPTERKFKYTVAIDCVGRVPTPPPK